MSVGGSLQCYTCLCDARYFDSIRIVEFVFVFVFTKAETHPLQTLDDNPDLNGSSRVSDMDKWMHVLYCCHNLHRIDWRKVKKG
jgi:hypothetical protein